MTRDTGIYKAANRALWDEWTAIHVQSEFYDVEGFKRGDIKLHSLEREEVGDVAGKSLLHLQCHFGLGTLSWARLGATVTGADFSSKSIEAARSLSSELEIPASFVCSDIDHLPEVLSGRFDIVFTSYGVLPWLPDLKRWAGVIAHFLKPGGVFYIAEAHPISYIFDDAQGVSDLVIKYPYFARDEPIEWKTQGSYADRNAHVVQPVSYEWPHTIGDIINALIGAGLRIEFLHEFPYVTWQQLPFMVEGSDGYWRLPDREASLPLLFSIRAGKG
jgi:SAM-dependent methyltransferase